MQTHVGIHPGAGYVQVRPMRRVQEDHQMTDKKYKVFKALMKRSKTECGFDPTKFAELVVQECAQVFWAIDGGELHEEYVRALKKHFGMKK
jgi:hypothetical protein